MPAKPTASRCIWYPPGPGGGGRQVERDRRDPAAAGTAGADRRAGHDRRHWHPIGTRSAIAAKILERGGDSLLALKANRPAPFKDVAQFFAAPPAGSVESFETIDGEHGRTEGRRHRVCHDIDWLFSDRRYPHEVAFPGLAMIARVGAETERGGKPRINAVTTSARPGSRPKPSPRRCAPIGHRDPAPVGARCRLPRRPRPPANQPRPGKHGCRQNFAVNLVQTAKPIIRSASKTAASSPLATSITSKPSSAGPHEPIHPVALQSDRSTLDAALQATIYCVPIRSELRGPEP
jgi:hypothetical protein